MDIQEWDIQAQLKQKKNVPFWLKVQSEIGNKKPAPKKGRKVLPGF